MNTPSIVEVLAQRRHDEELAAVDAERRGITRPAKVGPDGSGASTQRMLALAHRQAAVEAAALAASGPYRRAGADTTMAAVALHRAARVMAGTDHAIMRDVCALGALAQELDRRLRERAERAAAESQEKAACAGDGGEAPPRCSA